MTHCRSLATSRTCLLPVTQNCRNRGKNCRRKVKRMGNRCEECRKRIKNEISNRERMKYWDRKVLNTYFVIVISAVTATVICAIVLK